MQAERNSARKTRRQANPYDPDEARMWLGHPFRWSIALLKPVKGHYIVAMILTMVVAVMGLVPSIATGRIVDDVLIAGNTHNFWKYAIMLGLVPLIRAILRYTFRYIYESATQTALIRLRDALYERLQLLNPAYYHEVSTGALMARITGDLGMMRFFWGWVSWTTFEQIFLFSVGAIYLATISWKLTLACLCLAPIIAIVANAFSKAIRPVWEEVRTQLERLTAVVQENIAANRIVRAFVRQEYEVERFEKENAAYRDAQFETANMASRYIPIMQAVSISLSIPMLLLGGYFVIKGEMSLGNLITYSGLLFVLEGPMHMLGFNMNDLQRVGSSADKVLETLTERPRILDPESIAVMEEKEQLTELSREYSEEQEAKAKLRYNWRQNHKVAHTKIDDLVQAKTKSLKLDDDLPPMAGEILFKDVGFSYEKNAEPHEYTLRDLNFDIRAGSTVGFIGPTGSGKTTITRLITRLYDPLEGEISIDGKNLKDYNLRHLRRSIAVVPQDVFLFSDTVDGNIAFSQPDMPDEAIRDYAQLACADEFIRNMSEGYETIVGERGVGLSGGQKQRISLARALAANAHVLILDDTTSAVDMETDRQIRKNLADMKEAMGDQAPTTIIIAQRIASLRDCDEIFVLDRGHLAERGTHEELVHYGGIYNEIYKMQMGQGRKIKAQMEKAKAEGQGVSRG